jgi:hypothetical protein
MVVIEKNPSLKQRARTSDGRPMPGAFAGTVNDPCHDPLAVTGARIETWNAGAVIST